MEPNKGRSWKTHPLAVIALACSLAVCCPITSLLGVIFGWFSLRSIAKSEGRFGGRRLAIAAIVVGLLMLPIQFLALDRYETYVNELIDDGVARCVMIVFDVDEPDRKKVLQTAFIAIRSKYPSPGEADAFVQELTDALGAYRSVSVVQRSVDRESLLRQGLQLALVFEFENGTTTGGAACELVPAPPNIFPQVRLRVLEIDLPEGRMLQLPEHVEEPGALSEGDGEAALQEDAPSEQTSVEPTEETAE